ncbi:hypothetical protein Tco_0745036 [Tanacetum coccineum]
MKLSMFLVEDENSHHLSARIPRDSSSLVSNCGIFHCCKPLTESYRVDIRMLEMMLEDLDQLGSVTSSYPANLNEAEPYAWLTSDGPEIERQDERIFEGKKA